MSSSIQILNKDEKKPDLLNYKFDVSFTRIISKYLGIDCKSIVTTGSLDDWKNYQDVKVNKFVSGETFSSKPDVLYIHSSFFNMKSITHLLETTIPIIISPINIESKEYKIMQKFKDTTVYVRRNFPFHNSLDESSLELPSFISESKDEHPEITIFSETNDTISEDIRRLSKQFTFITSIYPDKSSRQVVAISTWLKAGFNVFSVNTSEEIKILSKNTSLRGVSFVEKKFGPCPITGKKGPPINFLLEIAACQSLIPDNIVTIINSDICVRFKNPTHMKNYLNDLKKILQTASVIAFPRCNIETFSSVSGNVDKWGYDAFMFRSYSDIMAVPSSPYRLGHPWWDYLIVRSLFDAGKKACSISEKTPFYHVKHEERWSVVDYHYCLCIYKTLFPAYFKRMMQDDIHGRCYPSVELNRYTNLYFKKEMLSLGDGISLHSIDKFQPSEEKFQSSEEKSSASEEKSQNPIITVHACEEKARDHFSIDSFIRRKPFDVPNKNSKWVMITSIQNNESLSATISAVESWLDICEVISLNTPSDIKELQTIPIFGRVTFVESSSKNIKLSDMMELASVRGENRTIFMSTSISGIYFSSESQQSNFTEKVETLLRTNDVLVELQWEYATPQNGGKESMENFRMMLFKKVPILPENNFTFGSDWYDYFMLWSIKNSSNKKIKILNDNVVTYNVPHKLSSNTWNQGAAHFRNIFSGTIPQNIRNDDFRMCSYVHDELLKYGDNPNNIPDYEIIVSKEQKLLNNDGKEIKLNTDKKKIRTAVCVQMKNEKHILNEFIAHYILLGVDHIYIYDNQSNPPIKDVISPKVRDYVTVNTIIASRNVQPESYSHCYKTYGKDYDWFFNIDADEFVVLYNHKSISDFLEQFDSKTVGTISLHWVLFGPHPHKTIPPGIAGSGVNPPTKLISEEFLYTETKEPHRSDYPYRYFYKQLYQPKAIDDSYDNPCQVHWVELKKPYVAVEVDGSIVKQIPKYARCGSLPSNEDKVMKTAVIYHYFTLWSDYYAIKVARNNATFNFGAFYSSLEDLQSWCNVKNTYYRDHISPKIRQLLGMPDLESI